MALTSIPLTQSKKKKKIMSSIFFLFSLLLMISSSLSVAEEETRHVSRAKKMIRELNLHPEHDVNIVQTSSDSSVLGEAASLPRLVEKRLQLSVSGHSGSSAKDLGHHAGYYRIPQTVDARMFYFFFESRGKKEDPVVIWLTGGPGCSSELALFYENGPYKLTENLTLLWNDFGWDKVSNLIYVDQPTGTGFSYSSSEKDLRHDEQGVSNDLYNFLQEFFKAHPRYVNNDFYITGESYAGHYIPAFASRIDKGNKNKQGIPIKLKGFGIGNGLTNPGIQYPAYVDYALNMSLITKADYDSISEVVPRCQKAIQQCGTDGAETCVSALEVCQNIFEQIVSAADGINYYDVRKDCYGSLCYDFSRMEEYLGQSAVKKSLGVGSLSFVSCSDIVHEAMQTDWMRNLEVGIPTLLEEGIQVLIYAGEYDLICNWLGNWRWVHAMEWSGQKDFIAAPTVPLMVDGLEAGQLKSHGPLTFLKVHNAGHMVPMDQPKNSLQMLQKWMQGKLAPANIDTSFDPVKLPLA